LSTNKWTALRPDTKVRNNPCGGAVGTTLYVAGGVNRTGNALTVNESFNPSKDIWTMLLPLPQATVGAASSVSGGQLFCFGGSNVAGTVLNNAQIYQP
jgi:N-acetylneuraminic acid mutarotase